MTYNEALQIQLKRLCKERKITPNKLATLSGLRQSTVRDIMTGTSQIPKISTLHKMAVGLDMTISQLLDFPEMNEVEFDDE